MKYFKLRLELYDKQLQFTNPFTTFYKKVESKRDTQIQRIENYEKELKSI
jgi:hypothetical protein